MKLPQLPPGVVADIEKDMLAVGKLGDAKHRVGGFALVVPLETSADRHGADRVGLVVIDRPARHVELVGALVVEVAVAGLPEPVPVIVDEVLVVLVDDGQSLPELPVEPGGRVGRVAMTDPAARFAAVAVGYLELAPLARLDRLVQPGHAGAAALLRAVLDHDSVLFLRRHRDAALDDVVAHRLLDVDVLAGLRAPDRHERVPMVRSGDGNGIHLGIVEGCADVGHALAGHLSALVDLLRSLHPLGQGPLLGIHHVGDLDIGKSAEA